MFLFWPMRLDIRGKEQLSVCLRYVLPDNSVQERLLPFEEATDLTGAEAPVVERVA